MNVTSKLTGSLPRSMAVPSTQRAVVSLVAGSVVWGVIWWPLQFFAGHGLTGHAIGLTAYTLVAALALPLIWRQRRQWRPETGLLLGIGLFFGCANLAFTTALTMGSVVRAMLLFYLLPFWGALGGKLFLGETIGPRRLAAVCLSLGGVAVILGGIDALRAPLSAADGVALAAGFFYTAAGIANRKAQAIPLASRTLASFVGCSAMAFALLAWDIPEVPALPASAWMLLVLFAVCWLMGGTLLTTYGVTHLPASRAAVLQVSELLVAVLSAVWLGGEALGTKECLGGGLILLAAWLEASSHSKG